MSSITKLCIILLIIAGLSFSSSTCYQESANATSACGGLSTGNYTCAGSWHATNTCAKTTDTNWTSMGQALQTATNYGYSVSEYRKPNGATGAYWQVAHNATLTNYSVPSTCWAAYANQLKFNATSKYGNNAANRIVTWYCYNGAGWTLLNQSPNSVTSIYEEAVHWIITEPAITLTTPADATNSYNTTYNFSWKSVGGNAAYYSNLTIDGVVNASTQATLNNTAYTFNITGFSSGTHTWNVTSWNGSVQNTSATWQFTVVNPPIIITQNYPPASVTTTNTSFNFNWTTYGSTSAFYSNLTIDGIVNASNIVTTNNSPANKTVGGFAPGTHNWSVTSWNGTNSNTSSVRYFTIPQPLWSPVGGAYSWLWKIVTDGDIIPHGHPYESSGATSTVTVATKRTLIEGFESGNISHSSSLSFGGNASLQGNVKRTGNYALNISSTASYSYVLYVTAFDEYGMPSLGISNYNYTTMRFYFRTPDATPANNISILSLSDIATVQSLNLTTDGHLDINGTKGTAILNDNTWYRIEVMSDNASDTIKTRVDGVADISFSGSVPAFNYFWLGASDTEEQTFEFYYDDLSLLGTDNISETGWIGGGEVVILLPDGNESISTNWIASTGLNWECIDEIPPSLSDYILATASDSYYATLSNVTINGTIRAVQASEIRVGLDESNLNVYANSTNYLTSFGSSEAGVTTRHLVVNDPGTPWTQTLLNNTTIGVEASTFTISISVYSLFMQVDSCTSDCTGTTSGGWTWGPYTPASGNLTMNGSKLNWTWVNE